MPLLDVFQQSRTLRFPDANIEAAYLLDRRERDWLRAQRVMVVLLVLAVALGLLIVGLSARAHTPVPNIWLVLRFGVLVPGLLLTLWLGNLAWGKERLQLLLGIAVAALVGVHALEWFSEWTPAMPLRALWVVPLLMLWAIVMTTPMGAKAALGATIGVLVIAQAGMMCIVPGLNLIGAVATGVAYVLGGYGLVLFATWRERDNRDLFAARYEHQRLANELREQYLAQQQLIAQRNEFVAGVLHDLRSPLTAVLLSTDVLRHSETLAPAMRATLLDDISQSAKRVDAFANRFLEQRSLERAAAKLALSGVLLVPVVERAVAHAQVSASNKGQKILCAPATYSPIVVADELLLDRAIGNLLNNAVKYSPHGATIRVRIETEAGAPARSRVSVADAGPGLTAAEQAHLFQPYINLGKKPTGGEPSTGLGLSLVKHCIEGMGGAVGCESMPGRGATFWLTLRHAGNS